MRAAVFEGIQRATNARDTHAVTIDIPLETLRVDEVGKASDVGPVGHGVEGL